MAQTRITQTQKQRHNSIGTKATPAWLVADQDPDGTPWFSVRLFFGVNQGPCYFGPFADKQQAEAFYTQAQGYIGAAICDLMNLVSAWQAGSDSRKEE